MPREKPKARKEFWKTVRRLRTFSSPTDGRTIQVRVTNAVPADTMGDCTQYKKHYRIRLKRSIADKGSDDVLYLLLAHEWAHALAWDYCTNTHGDAWGLAQAKLWRIIIGEFAIGDYFDLD